MSTLRVDTCELHSHSNDLRHREKFYDIIVKVEDRKFPCHRIILASALEYFRNMFCGNYNEAAQKEVELKGIDANDFELLLTHIYGGSVVLEESNVYRLLRISNYIGLTTLNNFCEEYIIEHREEIMFDTVLDIFTFARQLEKPKLVKALLPLLAQHFCNVSKDERLLWISRTELDEILTRLDLVKNKIPVLEFLIQWTNCHPGEVSMLQYKLEQLNIPSDLSVWFVKKIEDNSVILNNVCENVAGNVESAFEGEEEGIFYDENMSSAIRHGKMRSPTVMLYCTCHSSLGQYEYNVKSHSIERTPRSNFIGLNSAQFLKSVFIDGIQLFITRTYQDREICVHNFLDSQELAPRYYCSQIDSSSQIAVCGTNIYLYNDDSFFMFNADVGQWIHPTNKPLKTRNASLISYQNNLYLVGGMYTGTTSGNFQELNTQETGKMFQHYDPHIGIWSRLPNMIYGRSRFASCVHNNVLYASGGEGLSYYRALMEYYDFKASKWQVCQTKMPKPKKDHIVLGYSDRLYFFGKQKDLTWYSYDLKGGVWSGISLLYNKDTQINHIFDAEMKM